MSKTKVIILIIAIILLILFSFGYFYISNTDQILVEDSVQTEDLNFVEKILNLGNSAVQNPIDSIVDFVVGDDNTEKNQIKNKLNKISSVPITGYGLLLKERYVAVPDVKKEMVVEQNGTPKAPETEFIQILKYTDKTNGNIYETNIDNMDERKFSNSVIPSVHESFFIENGVIMRYLKNDSVISTFLGELPKEVLGTDSNNYEIFGRFLPDNIKEISISPSYDKIFYLTNTKNGVVGVLSDAKNNNKNQIFDSRFTEWTSYWPNNDLITLTTRPSGLVLGYSYLLNPESEEFSKILGGISGLTTLMNPNGGVVLYSDSNLSLNLFNVYNNESKNLKLNTHTEKCVWSKDSINLYCAIPKSIESGLIYPDSWYQGEVSYDDNIYKINTQTGGRVKITELPALDAINLKLDENEEFLFFINKIDSYLWELNLQ